MANPEVVPRNGPKPKPFNKAPIQKDGLFASASLSSVAALALMLLGCGGSTSAPIGVSVSPQSVSVQVGGTQQFVAHVTGDSKNQGVTWEVTCLNSPCGSVSPTTTPSDQPTVYSAPATTPATSLTVTLTARSVAHGSSAASAAITVPSIMVTVTPGDMTIEAGTTQQFTATVIGDASNSGVIWTVTQSGVACSPSCGTIAPANTASGVPATYTAPTAPPSNSLTVAVIATSVAASAVSGSASVTVSAITVSVTPSSALLPQGITQAFAGTVGYDPKSQGVAWALTQGGTSCSPTCGSISATTTASGSSINYTAPATAPASSSVALTATSLTDTSKTAVAAITLTTGIVQLVPDVLDFGQVLVKSTSNPLVSTLTNTGSAALAITGITLAGPNTADFAETNTCPSSLGAGSSCTITVTFKPTSSGSEAAIIAIADNSPDSPQQLNLKGNGKASILGSLAAVRFALADSVTAAVPIPTGPETVGTRTVLLRDPTRQDPLLADGRTRDLLVRFWYPASLAEPCRRADYTSPRVWEYFSQVAGVHLPEVTTHSCVDAPMKDGVHPIVVFTHGYTGTFTDHTFLFEDLASRSYVVASLDHTGEATAVEFLDGRFVPSKLGSYLENSERGDNKTLAFAINLRLQDLRFAVSEVERLNRKQGDPFASKLDVSRIAVAGYSLGGTAAYLALEQDARLRAAIILDGNFPAALIRPTEMPVLLLTAGSTNWSMDSCQLWNRLHGPRQTVNFSGAEHVALSDLVWLANGAIKTGTEGPESTVATIREQVAAFLDANLRERPVPPSVTALSGTSPAP